MKQREMLCISLCFMEGQIKKDTVRQSGKRGPTRAQRSGSRGEKEEGGCGYGVFAALTETAETE